MQASLAAIFAIGLLIDGSLLMHLEDYSGLKEQPILSGDIILSFLHSGALHLSKPSQGGTFISGSPPSTNASSHLTVQPFDAHGSSRMPSLYDVILNYEQLFMSSHPFLPKLFSQVKYCISVIMPTVISCLAALPINNQLEPSSAIRTFLALAKDRIAACYNLGVALIFTSLDRPRFRQVQAFLDNNMLFESYFLSHSIELQKAFLETAEHAKIKGQEKVDRCSMHRRLLSVLHAVLAFNMRRLCCQLLTDVTMPRLHIRAQLSEVRRRHSQVFAYSKVSPFLLFSILDGFGNVRNFIISNLRVLCVNEIDDVALLLSTLSGALASVIVAPLSALQDLPVAPFKKINVMLFFNDAYSGNLYANVICNRLTRNFYTFSLIDRVAAIISAFLDIAFMTCLAIDYLEPSLERSQNHMNTRYWLEQRYLHDLQMLTCLCDHTRNYFRGSVIHDQVHDQVFLGGFVRHLVTPRLQMRIPQFQEDLMAMLSTIEALSLDCGFPACRMYRGRLVSQFSYDLYAVSIPKDSNDVPQFCKHLSALGRIMVSFKMTIDGDLLSLCTNVARQQLLKYVEICIQTVTDVKQLFSMLVPLRFKPIVPSMILKEEDDDDASEDSFDIDKVFDDFVSFCTSKSSKDSSVSQSQPSVAPFNSKNFREKDHLRAASLHDAIFQLKKKIQVSNKKGLLLDDVLLHFDTQASRVSLSDELLNIRQSMNHLMALQSFIAMLLAAF